MIYTLAVFAPLAGALIAGLGGRFIGDRAAMAASVGGMLIAAVCGPLAWVMLEWGGAASGVVPIATWISAGSFHVNWALRYDPLAATMVAMVGFVSMLIHVYSIGDMAHDSYRRSRFFAYLSLFSFAMLMLVTANNLLQLFFGWEGVGLCSYLLIGYWYDRPSACAAAIKAFIVNRIGDLAFAIGVALTFLTFGSIGFHTIFSHLAQHQTETYHLLGGTIRVYELICTLLFIGAMGKSAQLFLHVWLPDAMEGPTPVSALIHAATMVTAGVFLVARMSPLMNLAPHTLTFITIIGGSTAFFAATIGCVQNDIKRVIAYSTCSQLGYMFLGEGVAAYPLRRLGHPRHVGRAGHAQDGRAVEEDPDHLRHHVGGQPGAGGDLSVRRVFLEGCDPGGGAGGAHRRRRLRLRDGDSRRGDDGVLFLAAAADDLPRHLAGRPPRAGACA
jgi:NADH-quinone oxidoreductase subunit L